MSSGGQIIIGTPGRVMDIFNRCKLINLKELEVLILDEADTLLDMGFRDTISQILSLLPKQRRTGLFSATQTNEVKDLARAGMRNPVTISVKVQQQHQQATSDHGNIQKKINDNNSRQQIIPTTLENKYIICPYEHRPGQIARFIQTRPDKKIIIFVATCACVDYYSKIFQILFSTKKSIYNNFNDETNLNVRQGGGGGKDGGKVLLDVDIPIYGLHGKMVTKKRNALYKKFINLKCGGVLFCTDIAARGVDIPNVDYIIQVTAPKDPSFFVHRVGRTARAGKQGSAILFVNAHELAYIELLRNRGVPLQEVEMSRAPEGRVIDESATGASAPQLSLVDAIGCEFSTVTASTSAFAGEAFTDSDITDEMRRLCSLDRALLESGSCAFISFIRAYREHQCNYIFRIQELDIGSVARSYALLKLPRIPETRRGPREVGEGWQPIMFEPMPNIVLSSVPYLQQEREEARQKRLEVLKRQKQEEERARLQQTSTVTGVELKEGERTVKKRTALAATSADEDRGKRKRAKKIGQHQRIMDEWDELAAEEYLFKQFKKGKLNKSNYDNLLLSDDVTGTAEEMRGTRRQVKGDGMMSDADPEDSDGSVCVPYATASQPDDRNEVDSDDLSASHWNQDQKHSKETARCLSSSSTAASKCKTIISRKPKIRKESIAKSVASFLKGKYRGAAGGKRDAARSWTHKGRGRCSG
jgi:ATP-dependent RNA helicase DDX55/SPB4